jgi:hypothetical protein
MTLVEPETPAWYQPANESTGGLVFKYAYSVVLEVVAETETPSSKNPVAPAFHSKVDDILVANVGDVNQTCILFNLTA